MSLLFSIAVRHGGGYTVVFAMWHSKKSLRISAIISFEGLLSVHAEIREKSLKKLPGSRPKDFF